MHQNYLKDLLKHIFAILRFLNQSIMLILLSYIINHVHIKSDSQYHCNNQCQQKVCNRFVTNRCYFNAVPSAAPAATAVAKSLQSCPTPCNPINGSPPGPLPLGFSRQEHWSGLSFPSPVLESEKWKWSRSVVSDPARPVLKEALYKKPPWHRGVGLLQACSKDFRCVN